MIILEVRVGFEWLGWRVKGHTNIIETNTQLALISQSGDVCPGGNVDQFTVSNTHSASHKHRKTPNLQMSSEYGWSKEASPLSSLHTQTHRNSQSVIMAIVFSSCEEKNLSILVMLSSFYLIFS